MWRKYRGLTSNRGPVILGVNGNWTTFKYLSYNNMMDHEIEVWKRESILLIRKK